MTRVAREDSAATPKLDQFVTATTAGWVSIATFS